MERRPDLTSVDPKRRALVRHRIEILERYLALPTPNWRDVVEAAESMGLAPPTVYRLASAWRQRRNPADLQGTAARRRLAPRVHGDEDFVNDVLRRHAPAPTVEQEVLRLEAEAKTTGVELRSRSALRRLVKRLRGDPRSQSETSSEMVWIDYCVLEIPIETTTGQTLPLAAMIIHPATRQVLGARLSLGGPSAGLAAATIARWAEAQVHLPRSADGIALRWLGMNIDRDPDWARLRDVLRSQDVDCLFQAAERVRAGNVVTTAFGGSAMGLKLHPRMVHRDTTNRRPRATSTELNETVTIDEAQVIVDDRIAAIWNEAPAPRLDDPQALAAALAKFVR